MAIGSFCDFLWIVCSIFPAMRQTQTDSQSIFLSNGFIYMAAIVSSIAEGFGLAVQWVSQGKYISDCATEGTKGFYFSYFWAFYMSSQVFGNMLASYLLSSYSLVTFYSIMGSIALVSLVYFLMLEDPIKP